MEWYGDCEAIFRETLIRACEVSLGLDHGQPVSPVHPEALADRDLLALPDPVVRGLGDVATHGSGTRRRAGHVLISTPGHGHPLKNTPLRDNEPSDSGYAQDPVSALGAQGMWVVSQSYHRPWPKSMTDESGLGEWKLPHAGSGLRERGAGSSWRPPSGRAAS